MSDPSNAVQPGWAQRLRTALIFAVMLMVGLVLWKAPWDAGDNYVMRSAYGSTIGASPGFLVMTIPGSGGRASDVKIYLIDSNKRVACVYAFRNEKIRLVSARKFERDMDILDASDVVRTVDGRNMITPPEGNNGFDRKTAADYADGLKKMIDDAEKKR